MEDVMDMDLPVRQHLLLRKDQSIGMQFLQVNVFLQGSRSGFLICVLRDTHIETAAVEFHRNFRITCRVNFSLQRNPILSFDRAQHLTLTLSA